MGKYPSSQLAEEYKHWHWNNPKIPRWCYGLDLDFIEVREKNGVLVDVAGMDIKEPEAKITPVQIAIYDRYENQYKLPFYIVWPKSNFCLFKVQRWKTKQEKLMNETEYIDWLKKL